MLDASEVTLEFCISLVNIITWKHRCRKRAVLITLINSSFSVHIEDYAKIPSHLNFFVIWQKHECTNLR